MRNVFAWDILSIVNIENRETKHLPLFEHILKVDFLLEDWIVIILDVLSGAKTGENR
jgi:hypothetical protein